MDFSNLFNNQMDVVKLLNNSFTKNRLVQTYLFYGEKGTLKMDAAMYLASLILCTNGGNCGECEECKRIEKFSNPNIFIVSCDIDTIKKEQIDDLEHEFSMASDHKRVFIIKDIDKATLSASNSLLKFLENLNDDCYGILLTENLNQVIQTIKSRSVIVHFKPMNDKVVANALINKGYDEDNSRAISQLTNNVSEALLFMKDKVLNEIIDLVKLIGLEIEENKDIYLEFIKNAEILKKVDKKYQGYFLDLLIVLQSDKVKILLAMKDYLIFNDCLEMCIIQLSRVQEVKILEIMLKYRQRLKFNVNIDLMYAEMFIEIGRVK